MVIITFEDINFNDLYLSVSLGVESESGVYFWQDNPEKKQGNIEIIAYDNGGTFVNRGLRVMGENIEEMSPKIPR